MASAWYLRLQLSRKHQFRIDDHTNPLMMRDKPQRLHRHSRRKLRRVGG